MKPIDDIKLTAYALGELSAEERQQVEEQLNNNPAQQAEVAEIQALASQLETELQAEPAPELTDKQRQAILAAPGSTPSSRSPVAWHRWGSFAAVAATVTLVFGGLYWNASHSLHKDLLISMNETGEMAVGEAEPMVECLEELTPTATPEFHAMGGKGADPQAMLLAMVADTENEAPEMPAPDVQEFAAAPVSDVESYELDIVSDRISPIIMKSMAPGSMSCRSGAGRQRISRKMAINVVNGSYCTPQTECLPPMVGNTESYANVDDNVFKQVASEPLSTFSIDVDTASYANIRRFLKGGQMPPTDAVRIEEMINYFSYDYPQPTEDVPFAVHVESATCPWNEAHQLVKIGLKGKELDPETRPPCNLVFLLDVSGSMSSPNKLPLVKKALKLLTKQLTPEDSVSIVVYASASGLVLPATTCDNLQAIETALENLQAGGSTAGGAGIRLAYDEALKNLQTNGVNRVILCTDGDFNVGITDSDELSSFIAGRAKKGIFLTVLGFGMGNIKDDRLETLADKGNGHYAYIDTFSEARKNLSDQAAGTLFTIAKDVKLQIEFNPAHFDSYRLIGYENRVMAKEDFNNDKKDAGELGAGHTVTAFYELVPKGVEVVPGVDPLKYQAVESEPVKVSIEAKAKKNASPEWLTVKLRYKLPKEDTSTKIEIPYTGTFAPFESASEDFRFAAGVAAGGLLMREDARIGDLTYHEVIGWTSATTGNDPHGYRREYLDLLKNAAALAP